MQNIDCMGCVAAHMEGCPHPGSPVDQDGLTHWTLPARRLEGLPIPICTLEWDEAANLWWCDQESAWIAADGGWWHGGTLVADVFAKNVDCMACIANDAAGCPREDNTETVLGVTHWMARCVTLGKVEHVGPVCGLTWSSTAARWMDERRVMWARKSP